MSESNKNINHANKIIFDNIEKLTDDAGLLAQNILAQLRNLVEDIAVKIDIVDNNKEGNSDHKNIKKSVKIDIVDNKEGNRDHKNIKKAIKYIKTKAEYKWMVKFHKNLQESVSHYSLNKEDSERLMYKYIEKLYSLKDFVKSKFGLTILENIYKFPLKRDTQTEEYYRKIIEKIETAKITNSKIERCYIQKKKPIFLDGKIYYELTVTLALSNISKFDRVIVFTNFNLKTNYAVKLWLNETSIDILGNSVPIKFASSWQVSIRPCEYSYFSKIFGEEIKGIGNSNEAKRLNDFLTNSDFNLVDIINLPYDEFNSIKKEITKGLKVAKIFNLLDKCRDIKDGKNIIKYLLFSMTHKVIKNQLDDSKNPKLSNLNLKYGCIPFDVMPLCFSLIKHNISFYNLVESIGIEGREHEIIARKIKNNTESYGKIYTPITKLGDKAKIENFFQTYNNKLYKKKHKGKEIKVENDLAFIYEYESEIIEIIKKFKEKTLKGLKDYSASMQAWVDSNKEIDCEKKKEVLPKLFETSTIAFVYGSAGTGKTTLIKHLTDYLNESNQKEILYLAHTNTAVDNLKKRIGEKSGKFMNITECINNKNSNSRYDLVVVDESSTVSNKNIFKVLDNLDAEMMLFVGDIHQIESIEFGNWFKIINEIFPAGIKYELENPFRTKNNNLLNLWKRVRENSDNIVEIITKNNFSKTLDESVFLKSKEDEIILCLNYGGLYGINNINKLLQAANNGRKIEIGLVTFKIGDPVIFNESNRFRGLLHNNLKGKIMDFEEQKTSIIFKLEIDKVITESDIRESNIRDYDDIKFEPSENEKTIVRFKVSKIIETDEDNNTQNNIVPFQLAYAMSIHKAQGLEYDSVKVVICNEIDEKITHNIFYTAITRAKKDLKIFWSKETMQSVISNFDNSFDKNDIHVIASKLEKQNIKFE